jgi:hypothetical protein
MARVPVQKANGGSAVKTAITANGSSLAFFVVPAAASGKTITVNTFRNSAQKGFDAAPETLPIENAANELYIVGNLLTNTFNNADAQVEFKTSGTGTLIVVDKSS